MKIGIYCCGYLRGFRTSLIKLKELLLDRYDCDLYFYLICNEYESDKYINSKYNIDELIEECNPKFYILEKNKYDNDPIQRIKQMWFKIYTCNKIRNEIEGRDNIKYDYIIRIRPDLKLDCSKKDIDKYFEIASTNKIIIPKSHRCSYPDIFIDDITNYRNYNDQFAIGTPKNMDIYCGLYKSLKKYNLRGIWNSSSCLYEHLNSVECCLVDCPSTLLLRENTIITISGDSGTGKSTLANKLKDYFDKKTKKVLLYECDRYHKWPRGDNMWKKVTHLNPDANYIEQMKDDIVQLKSNTSIEQVEYDHCTGKFTQPQLIEPLSMVIVLGLHTLFNSTLNKISNCKIYIEPEELLKKEWKINRDNKERGYTIEQSLKAIEERKEDYETYIKPQKDNADIVIKYTNKGVIITIKKEDREFSNIDDCIPLIEQFIFKES